jgi:hypothetical protein
MKEYKLMLPLADNGGVDLSREISDIAARAVELFGGFTMGGSMLGAWRNPETSEVFFERVQPFYLASADDALVRRFAGEVCEATRQICIYLRNPAGDVEFISAPPTITVWPL